VCFDFLYNFWLKHLILRIIKRNITNLRWFACEVPLFLPYFSEAWIFKAYIRKRKFLEFQISWKFVQRKPRCSTRTIGVTDGRIDSHDKANSRFHQFCKRANKWLQYFQRRRTHMLILDCFVCYFSMLCAKMLADVVCVRIDACPSAFGSYSVQSIGDILASGEGYSFIVWTYGIPCLPSLNFGVAKVLTILNCLYLIKSFHVQ